MKIYTDGSCKINPGGPGGYGVVIYKEDSDIVLMYNKQYPDDYTTNNMMEIKAILYAYSTYGIDKDSDGPIPIVYSDSAYCVNTFNSWIFTWRKNHWKKSDNKTPLNLKLLYEFIDLYDSGKRINIEKIKGHKGELFNELADALAKNDLAKKQKIVKKIEELYNVVCIDI